MCFGDAGLSLFFLSNTFLEEEAKSHVHLLATCWVWGCGVFVA